MVDQAGSEKSGEFTFICVNTETDWMRNHTLSVTDCILWAEIQRHRETDRETDTQRDTETHKETERNRDRHREKHRDRQNDRDLERDRNT